MKLNIYNVSHPIIKILSNRINENETQQNCKYIGLLLVYEIFRKYINLKKIYIKQIKSIKYYDIINKNKKYFILTNISQTYDMINEIKIILPQIQIIHIDYSDIKNIEKSIKDLTINVEKDKILIIEKITKNNTVMNLIQYLTKQKNLQSKNIYIGSIISNEETLNEIGSYYPKLTVYTTKIIYQNK
nr:Uracil phosphoribosyltransferase [Echinothamnion sp.]